ncbi:HNH endonuclease signature motif containing protein [Ornithinimicrobium pratense]|uniref:DUF222 domain-containing protein n=1 Tax=Ornithinimicrobium pratense TaxID=2593973 RepID=A0A5J6V318_9MICO|nr:HNH endonuclease signature motif containing protein [Ornithinimicrobium pratense]QFG68067.1 DUF222 domain-containing protein [Ornithinimicrobium pratense]
MALIQGTGQPPREGHVGAVVEVLGRQLNSMGRPAGVDAAAWAAEQEERLCTLADELFVPPHPVDAEELAYWALVADLERHGVGDSLDHDAGEDRYAVGGSDVDDAGGGNRAPGLPAQELAAGLEDAARGLARAALTEDESVRVLDAGIVSGTEALGRLRAEADARMVLLALEASARGLHAEKGLSLPDWLRARCPWLPPQDATNLHQIVKCASLASGGPLKQVAITGQAPLHRAALVARTLNRVVRCVDVDQHEGYAQILADAAANPNLSDAELARVCAELIRALLDDPPEREKTAEELRRVTRRAVGEGLTRFTIDAPDAAAATLDGILTSKLAAPAPGVDETGLEVADPRSAGQRQFDALMTVVNRGLSNPGAAPSAARASVLLLIPFDPDKGAPSGVAHTPTGLLIGERNAGKLSCSADITPVWVGPGNEPLALGHTARCASPGQFKALVVRDEHCTFPGCSRPPQWCDVHHLTWWSRGGRTDVDQMALLCEQHHTHVHLHDISGEVAGGHVVWHV